MSYRTERKDSRFSKLAKGLALLSLQLALLTVILHRFAHLSTPVALNLFAACLVGGALAILFAIFAWIGIWYSGDKGAGRAGFAVVVALILFAYPAFLLPQVMALPVLNDVTTDAIEPPAFRALAQERARGANSVIYPRSEFAKRQAEAYPDIQPIYLDRSPNVTFQILQKAVQKMKWDVASQQTPAEAEGVGRIEAKDHTLVMGFVDDISIRVSGEPTRSRIDIRSASRYGRHDLGRNAERIRALVAELKESVTAFDRAIAAKREARIKAESKKKAEMERRAALRRERAARARARKRRVQKRKVQQPWPF